MSLQELFAVVLDHLRGMWRYRWWAMAVAWLVMGGGTLFVYSMPDVYRASSRIYVDTDSLLRPLMQGLTASQNTLNEVQLLSRVVLTRLNMEKVMYATDLDLRVRTDEARETLITDLQNQVTVSGGRDNIFTIEYEDPSRDKARDVVAAVRDIFVETALGDQGNEVEIAQRALGDEYRHSGERLSEKEQEIARFKQENVGYMPDQAGDYYDRLQNARGRLAETTRELELATIRRDERRRQIAGEEPVFGLMPSTGTGGCTHSGQIAELEAERARLSVQFTDKYPRLASLEQMIVKLTEDCAEEAAISSGSSFTGVGPALETNPVYQNMRIQLNDAEVDVERLRAQQALEQQEVERLAADVDKILSVETQLKELTRDLDVIRSRNQELLKRWEDLQTKIRLDPVSAGARFDVIDPPFADNEPVGPNRPALLAAVLALSLAAGGVLAFLLNQAWPVFFTRSSLKSVVDYPVIGSVTMLLPPAVVARRRMEALTWGLASLLLLVFAGAAMLAAPWAGLWLRNLMVGGSP